KRDPSLRCVLIGHGMEASNAPLMSLINGHGLGEKVKLLGRRDDVPRLMNARDIHVLSSRAEGFPNVVAEAMATGVACVVTVVGDAAVIVGSAGWVAEPQNSTALARAIEEAVAQIGTPALQERVKEGRERVGRLFSLEAMV